MHNTLARHASVVACLAEPYRDGSAIRISMQNKPAIISTMSILEYGHREKRQVTATPTGSASTQALWLGVDHQRMQASHDGGAQHQQNSKRHRLVCALPLQGQGTMKGRHGVMTSFAVFSRARVPSPYQEGRRTGYCRRTRRLGGIQSRSALAQCL